jgi:hypothetical protein
VRRYLGADDRGYFDRYRLLPIGTSWAVVDSECLPAGCGGSSMNRVASGHGDSRRVEQACAILSWWLAGLFPRRGR